MGGCISDLNNTFIYLDWDSDYFGIPSYKLVLNSVIDLDSISSIYKNLPENSFLTVINERNNKTNNILLTTFFKEDIFFADFNIRYVQNCEMKNYDGTYNFDISDCLSYDLDVDELSKTCFKYSRFFNDYKLNFEKKLNIYSHWVNTAFNTKGRYFLRFFQNSKTIAFILFNYDEIRKTSVIELIAIDKEYQHKGIGSMMITVLKNYLVEKEIEYLYVGTQSENIEAMNFYSKNKFKIEDCNSIYHVWK